MKQVVLTFLCLGALSCGNSKQATFPRDFKIELYSYGGIAGGATGITVTGDGWARFWSGRTANLRTILDSVEVDLQHLARIDSIAVSEEVTAFHSESIGDMTTVLIVQRGGEIHRVSFVGEQVPTLFPQPVKNLMSELANIHPPKTNIERKP